jgi:hypothetical protein
MLTCQHNHGLIRSIQSQVQLVQHIASQQYLASAWLAGDFNLVQVVSPDTYVDLVYLDVVAASPRAAKVSAGNNGRVQVHEMFPRHDRDIGPGVYDAGKRPY